MGTRADFYTQQYEWIGSIAWDGYPDGLPNALIAAATEDDFVAAVQALSSRHDWTSPKDGWPWPWEDSNTTDYGYMFKDSLVLASSFGGDWFKAADYSAEDPEEIDLGSPEYPPMDSSNFTIGPRSGLLIISA